MNQIRIPLFKTDLSLVRTLRLHINESIGVCQNDISADIIEKSITDFLSGTNWSLIPETYNQISFIARRRRRGRNRSNNSNIKEHTSKDIDNLLRKINVHFLTFMVNFFNDILKTENIPFFLKQIDTKIKITVKFESFSKLKNSTITNKQIFSFIIISNFYDCLSFSPSFSFGCSYLGIKTIIKLIIEPIVIEIVTIILNTKCSQ